MSPENCGVFLAFERGDFLKISGILRLAKMRAFRGSLVPELGLYADSTGLRTYV